MIITPKEQKVLAVTNTIKSAALGLTEKKAGAGSNIGFNPSLPTSH